LIGKDFIISKTRCLLNEFIAPIVEKTDKPRQKFLRQAVGAILLSGSLVVTDFGQWIHDDCSDNQHFVTCMRQRNFFEVADILPFDFELFVGVLC